MATLGPGRQRIVPGEGSRERQGVAGVRIDEGVGGERQRERRILGGLSIEQQRG